MEFVSIVSDVTAEIDLSSLLKRVMEEATKMLNADRATLFLNDEKTQELFSRVAMGEGVGEIRLQIQQVLLEVFLLQGRL